MASLTYPKFVNGETAFHRDFNSHVWADHSFELHRFTQAKTMFGDCEYPQWL